MGSDRTPRVQFAERLRGRLRPPAPAKPAALPPEDVYVYPVRAPRENLRRIFLEYVRKINGLRARPEFYNTLATNCTTAILMNTLVNPGSLPLSWKVLVSGYAPEYVYNMGRLDQTLPFEELRRRSLVNKAALLETYSSSTGVPSGRLLTLPERCAIIDCETWGRL